MSDFKHIAILRHWQKSIGEASAWEAVHHKQSVFLITTNIGQRLILKKVLHQPTPERLVSEYNVLRYLHEHCVPVSVPLMTDDQHLYVKAEGHIFMLSPALVSTNASEETNDQMRYTHIGHALAHFHQVLATYPNQIPSWTMNLPKQLEDEVFPRLERDLSPSK